MGNNSTKPTVAIIATTGLGDALVHLIIANNLARHGYHVTFFSNYAVQLREFIKGNYEVDKYPLDAKLISTLDKFSVVLFEADSIYVKALSDSSSSWLAKHGISYLMSGGKNRFPIGNIDTLRARFPNDKKHHLALFLRFHNKVRTRNIGLKRDPMVHQIAAFLKNTIKLKNVTTENGIGLARKNPNNRVVLIHPTSSSSKKNWGESQYIELANRLAADSFKPVITVSPAERSHWLALAQDRFEVPIFDDIAALARFYQYAGWFIGNDSGNAHLASLIGISTLQIFPRWRHYPSWRAGWAQCKVLTAPFPKNLSRTDWQAGLTVDTVFKEFTSFASESNTN